MDMVSAMILGFASRGEDLMVFDWDRAASIIKERGATNAFAGLRSDYEWTGGDILVDGKPCRESYTYLSSMWAVPELVIDGDTIPCFKMESETDGWGHDTKWPPSSIAILEGAP